MKCEKLRTKTSQTSAGNKKEQKSSIRPLTQMKFKHSPENEIKTKQMKSIVFY